MARLGPGAEGPAQVEHLLNICFPGNSGKRGQTLCRPFYTVEDTEAPGDHPRSHPQRSETRASQLQGQNAQPSSWFTGQRLREKLALEPTKVVGPAATYLASDIWVSESQVCAGAGHCSGLDSQT